MKLNAKQIEALQLSLKSLNEGILSQEKATAYKTIVDMLTSQQNPRIKATRKNRYKSILIQHPLDGSSEVQYDGFRDASRKLGVGHSLISRCASGDRKTAYGSTWEIKTIKVSL